MTVFLLGLAVGACLLIIGLLVGYWIGRKTDSRNRLVDLQQFLDFLRELSQWTSDFSGDVSKFQSQLSSISAEVTDSPTLPKEEIVKLLTKIMHTNQQLQSRLDNAEEQLETQTGQISDYLTEARTDGLTGLSNRRALDTALAELFERWETGGEPFSLGIIDVDHFKQINDTHGHPGGDAVLRQIAARIRSELPDARCVARFGGEEFAVLSKSPLQHISSLFEQLRTSVADCEFQHERRYLPVTISGGTAEIKADDSLQALLKRADEALYAAKLAGRNLVYEHDGVICRKVTPESVDSGPLPRSPVEEPDQETDDLQLRLQKRFRRLVEEESRRALKR